MGESDKTVKPRKPTAVDFTKRTWPSKVYKYGKYLASNVYDINARHKDYLHMFSAHVGPERAENFIDHIADFAINQPHTIDDYAPAMLYALEADIDFIKEGLYGMDGNFIKLAGVMKLAADRANRNPMQKKSMADVVIDLHDPKELEIRKYGPHILKIFHKARDYARKHNVELRHSLMMHLSKDKVLQKYWMSRAASTPEVNSNSLEMIEMGISDKMGSHKRDDKLTFSNMVRNLSQRVDDDIAQRPTPGLFTNMYTPEEWEQLQREAESRKVQLKSVREERYKKSRMMKELGLTDIGLDAIKRDAQKRGEKFDLIEHYNSTKDKKDKSSSSSSLLNPESNQLQLASSSGQNSGPTNITYKNIKVKMVVPNEAHARQIASHLDTSGNPVS